MQNSLSTNPDIIVGEADYRLLNALATTGAAAADDLLIELERARIVPDGELPPATVRMGSTVTYRTAVGAERTVTLVYPAEADIALGRISVLTPVGTALIGLMQGQSIAWTVRDGKNHVLAVLVVSDPA